MRRLKLKSIQHLVAKAVKSPFLLAFLITCRVVRQKGKVGILASLAFYFKYTQILAKFKFCEIDKLVFHSIVALSLFRKKKFFKI
ncbi:hypothetical protein DMC01_03280 [Campylobacter troglodytis]|nr:hypothetical protein DMC01_03280 [Campylobacter troglodytis]